MFQYRDNDINSYNSLSMSQTAKGDFKTPKLYSSSKIIMTKANIEILSTEKVENNNENKKNKLNEIELNGKMYPSNNLTKLPKIAKYKMQANSIIDKNMDSFNINQLISITNSIDKVITGTQNLKQSKHKLIYNEQLKKKNLSKKTKNALKLGSTNYACDNDKKNIDPKLGKMKEFIILPDFIGNEPLTEMLFNPILEENLIKPQNEKQYEINLYLNSNKMLNNLIYCKIPLTKDGFIITQNIINVKKLFNENKNKDNEDEEIPDQEEQKEKENIKKPTSANEEITPSLLNITNKTFVSISEYPGNYIRKTNIRNERELKLSRGVGIKKNDNDNNENNMMKSNRGSINLNIYEIYKRNQNNSEIYVDNNSDNYLNKSNRIQKGIDFYDNSAINYNDSSDINDEKTNKAVVLNTIYGDIQPYYKLRDNDDDTLIFESRFESGNLLCAFKTEKNSYQLYLQNDTNTTGYIQWFFFRVSNTKKGNKTNFTIINMLRSSCIYKKGLKIMIYSKKQAQTENIGWHRDCENIMYYTNNLFTYNEKSKIKRSLNSLSFDYEFKYDNDTVYFANCCPYFYSKLVKEIKMKEKKHSFFFKKVITQTLGGNDLYLLNINTSKPQNKIYSANSTPQLDEKLNQKIQKTLNASHPSDKNNSKKAVIMIARQHPGETVGSYVIEGCIDFLLGKSEEAKKLREIYNFQIIPMMNPDGVLVGNSRTGFAGCDLNRRWSKPNEIIHPEIYYTKKIILKTAITQNIAFIMDFHGHFGTYNSLFYCNHKEDKKACSLFPYLCSELSDIISFEQTTFSMPKYKASTERLSLFRELKDKDNNNIIASETSFFGYRNEKNEKNYYFNKKLLNDIGRDVCLGMLSYYIKYENISIENNINFLNDVETLKKLDVDMKQYESELIDGLKVDDENDVEELSESEPSIDNLDKKEIMRLMPVYQKKKKKKGKSNFNGYFNNKIRKLEKYLSKRKNGLEKNNNEKNKNIDLDIELYNPLKKVTIRKIEEEKKLKVNDNPQIKSSPTNTSTIPKQSKTIHTPNSQNTIMSVVTESIYKNAYTQTEDIFFRMPWTFFVGKFKILTAKKRKSSNNLPNITTIPINMGITNSSIKNPFSFSANKRSELIIKAKIRKTNWLKFGILDEKNFILRNQNYNNIKTIKNSIKNYRELSLRDKANSYLTRFNGFILNRKKNNYGNISSNKGSVNKEKNISEYNSGKKSKNNSEGKIIYENIKNS